MMSKQESLAVECVLMAGRIMIEAGADMTRVDDTLHRIAYNAEIKNPKIFETTTAITMSVPQSHQAQVEPIKRRAINLEKVAQVNDASRAFAEGRVDLEAFWCRLLEIDQDQTDFKFGIKLLAAMLVSGTLLIMYGKAWQDFVPTLVVSGVSFSIYTAIRLNSKLHFVSEFCAAMAMAFLASLFVRIGFGSNVDSIIIGAVMPLVPGVPITNSFRDLLAGHILSGLARGAEAFLTAGAIGLGIAMVLRFM